MGDTLECVGTVSKITTADAKGGALILKVELPEDPDVARTLHANRQRMADITFQFKGAVVDDGADTENGNLFDGEDE